MLLSCCHGVMRRTNSFATLQMRPRTAESTAMTAIRILTAARLVLIRSNSWNSLHRRLAQTTISSTANAARLRQRWFASSARCTNYFLAGTSMSTNSALIRHSFSARWSRLLRVPSSSRILADRSADCSSVRQAHRARLHPWRLVESRQGTCSDVLIECLRGGVCCTRLGSTPRAVDLGNRPPRTHSLGTVIPALFV